MAILIKGAELADGSGAPRQKKDILVRGGRIARIADPGQVCGGQPHDHMETLDGAGLICAPGFIDTHSHSDLYALTNPEILPKVMQGITTEVLGQDGISLSPLPKIHIRDWRENLAGLDGESDAIDWNYETTARYMDMLEEARPSTNLAYLAPHGNIRLKVMGFAGRPATKKEREAMCRQMRLEMESGCIGLSTGLIYIPCAFADTEELIALCRVVAEYDGVFVVHQRSEADDILPSMKEVIRIGRESGVRVHFSHFKVCGSENWDKIPEMLRLLDEAREEGIPVSFDQYPYVAGSTMLGVLLPPWAHEGGTGMLLKRLEDPAKREAMRRDILQGIPGWDNFVRFAGFARIFVTSVRTDRNRRYVGKSIEEIARAEGKDCFNTLFDLLLEEDNAVGMVDFYGKEDHVKTLLKRPEMNACTDGLLSGQPHPRVYGAFPRILGKYVREEGALTLEEAIRKMTGKAAEAMNLPGRGLVKEGYFADLVLFDPDAVRDKGTFEQPRQYPDGIRHVIIGGKLAVRDGRFTGQRTGTVLRRPLSQAEEGAS